MCIAKLYHTLKFNSKKVHNVCMKYSIGFSNSRSRRYSPARRRTTKKMVGTSFSGLGFDKHKQVKKYTSRNIGSKRVKRNDSKGGKNPEFKKKLKKALVVFVGVLFFFGCAGLIGVGIYLKKLGNALPSPDKLVDRSSDQSTQIFDRNGSLLYTIYGDQNREFVSLDKIPEHTRKAVLAAEDAEFYQHRGLDYLGIAKAIVSSVFGKQRLRGASTITQQLVKNTILTDVLGEQATERTLSRKIKEALITMQVEQTFTKDEILQMYMNEVALGGVNYGFQAAAHSYFDKDVSELDLAESALLAGLIQSPGAYSPLFGSMPEMAKVRQTYVLDQLKQKHRIFGIDDEEIEKAMEQELVYSSRKIDIKAPHFVFYVKGALEEEFGTEMVERGGLKVTTTLDLTLQDIAEEELIKGVDANKRRNVHNGAMVVMNPKNGQVLAMVGSRDYWNTQDPRVDGNVNITTSMRQMGSSVKPFVYLNMIQQGYGPWLATPDIKEISFNKYRPPNWDLKYGGFMLARKALVQSRNVPTVYSLQLGGIDNYLQLMQKLGIQGIENKASYGLSMGLGSTEMRVLDMTNAYATLANSGVRHETTTVLKVEDSRGNVLKEYKESEGQRVIDEKEAYVTNWMICDLDEFGDRYGRHYFYIGKRKLCGKTGTSDGPKDLLAFQYNQSLVVGVWNGNNNNEVMPGGWSSTISLSISNAFFRRVIDNYNEFKYNRPPGIITTKVCIDTGATPAEGVECKTEASIYIAGRAPQIDNRKKIEICKANGLMPTNLEQAKNLGLVDVKTLLTTKLENAAQEEAYKKYLLGLKDSSYIFELPEEGLCPLPLGEGNAPVVEISKPISGGEFEAGKSIEISGNVRFLDSLSAFTVTVNGVSVPGVGVATVRADGTFVVNYVTPSIPTLNIVVTARDAAGKTDSKSVQIQMKGSSSASVKIIKPTNGKISKGAEILSTVSGGKADKVMYKFGGINYSLDAVEVAGGWSGIFSPPDGLVLGSKRITVKAIAMVNGVEIESPTVELVVQ